MGVEEEAGIMEGPGVRDDALGEDGEDDDEDNFENQVLNKTEWESHPMMQQRSKGPGLMHMTWGIGSTEDTTSKKELRDILDEARVPHPFARKHSCPHVSPLHVAARRALPA